MNSHIHYDLMGEALNEARSALEKDEVPVGSVLCINGKIIGRGHNVLICSSDPTAHAEICAIREACKQQGSYRLPGATLYVTLEPCVMCVGAILQARIEEVVFGAREPISGAAGSIMNALESGWMKHRAKVTAGIRADESSQLLKRFFEEKR